MLIVAHDQIRQKTDRRSHRLHSLAQNHPSNLPAGPCAGVRQA